MTQPNNKEWRDRLANLKPKIYFGTKENHFSAEVIQSYFDDAWEQQQPQFEAFIASERVIAQEEVLREISKKVGFEDKGMYQSHLDCPNEGDMYAGIGYREAKDDIQEMLKKLASSLGIDLTTNEEEK